MKKWFVLALIACVAVAVQAGEGEGDKKGDGKGKGKGKSVTKEQFIANQKKNAENKGIEFDQAAAEAKFDKMDKDKDGVLTGDEKSKGKKKGKDKDKGKDQDKDKGETGAE